MAKLLQSDYLIVNIYKQQYHENMSKYGSIYTVIGYTVNFRVRFYIRSFCKYITCVATFFSQLCMCRMVLSC